MRKSPIALSVVLVVVCIVSGVAVPVFPKIAAPVIDGMAALNKVTPPGSFIWAWWDNGYPIQFWGHRGTAGDGGINDGELCYYTAIPLVTNSQEAAANWMIFYAANGREEGPTKFCADAVTAGASKDDGMECLKRALAVGPKDAKAFLDQYGLTDKWLHKLYPQNHRPVYLFLDYRLTQTSYWWFWHGSWVIDEQRGLHPSYYLTIDAKETDNAIVAEDAKVDLKKGTIWISKFNKTFVLKKLVRVERGALKETKLNERGLEFYWIPAIKVGAVMSEDIGRSVFNQLFMMHQYSDYFKPVLVKTPFYQIWEVKGDEL